MWKSFYSFNAFKNLALQLSFLVSIYCQFKLSFSALMSAGEVEFASGIVFTLF